MRHSGLDQLLATWLPAQRWFAGGGATTADLKITSDVRLTESDPELRHLMIRVRSGQESVAYQVLVGFRDSVAPEHASSVIGVLPDGRVAFDAVIDPELMATVLGAISTQAAIGPLRFAAEPGAVIDGIAPGRALPALASNTSVVFGNTAILKLLRRPFEGHHPDLEIPAALARAGSKLVAAPLGWIELSGGGQSGGGQSGGGQSGGGQSGEPVLLAILSEFFAGATDGWELAIASLLADHPDFTGEARQLGEATARMHAELAAAFGTSVLSRAELASLSSTMNEELAQAVGVVPELAEYEAGIRACYGELADPAADVVVQRIHGDYHLAQVLGIDGGWVVLDFEGEPSVPLARRRAFAPALRDVAGMLRSFDYAARHQALLRPADQRFSGTAADWATRCQAAFCAGYTQASAGDPLDSGPLLRALVFSKAVYEAVYEVRHRPAWLPIPLAALAEARS